MTNTTLPTTSPAQPQTSSGGETPDGSSVQPSSNSAFSKIGGSLRTFASDAVKNTAGNAAAIASQVKAPFAATQKTPQTVFTG